MEQERNHYKKKSEELHKKSTVQTQSINRLKVQLKHQIKVNTGLEQKLEQQIAQMKTLTDMALISEEMRKLFSEQLRESMVRDEASRNENFNHSMQ